MKIIGLLLTWNNFEFFKCALQQALSFCDEILLVEGCHSKLYPAHSTDGTYEYIQTINNPKIKIINLEKRFDRYDLTQRFLREEIPKKSKYWKPGNWLFYLDDDIFFSSQDILEIKKAIQVIKFPTFTFNVRYFFYNFRFNLLQRGGNYGYKILDNFKLRGLSAPCYMDGKRFHSHHLDIYGYHYCYVKKPERMKARWDMSIEKGTASSIGRFDKWMSIKWDKDEAILKQVEKITEIRPEGKFNIYNGKHPEILDNHPWRYIDDVRRC